MPHTAPPFMQAAPMTAPPRTGASPTALQARPWLPLDRRSPLGKAVPAAAAPGAQTVHLPGSQMPPQQSATAAFNVTRRSLGASPNDRTTHRALLPTALHPLPCNTGEANVFGAPPVAARQGSRPLGQRPLLGARDGVPARTDNTRSSAPGITHSAASSSLVSATSSVAGASALPAGATNVIQACSTTESLLRRHNSEQVFVAETVRVENHSVSITHSARSSHGKEEGMPALDVDGGGAAEATVRSLPAASVATAYPASQQPAPQPLVSAEAHLHRVVLLEADNARLAGALQFEEQAALTAAAAEQETRTQLSVAEAETAHEKSTSQKLLAELEQAKRDHNEQLAVHKALLAKSEEAVAVLTRESRGMAESLEITNEELFYTRASASSSARGWPTAASDSRFMPRSLDRIEHAEVKVLRAELARRDQELMDMAAARHRAAEQSERTAASLRAKLAELEMAVAATPSASSRASSTHRSETGSPGIRPPGDSCGQEDSVFMAAVATHVANATCAAGPPVRVGGRYAGSEPV